MKEFFFYFVAIMIFNDEIFINIINYFYIKQCKYVKIVFFIKYQEKKYLVLMDG